MGNLGKVYHIDLVGDGLAQCYRQFHRRFLELAGIEDGVHGYDVRLGVRHLYADRSLARHRSDDTDAYRRQTQCNVIFEVLDLGDADALCRSDFIEGDGRPDGSPYAADLYPEVVQYLDDAVLVRFQFLVAYITCLGVGIVLFQQIECRKLPVCEWFTGIDRCQWQIAVCHGPAMCLFGVRDFFHFQAGCLLTGCMLQRIMVVRSIEGVGFALYGSWPCGQVYGLGKFGVYRCRQVVGYVVSNRLICIQSVRSGFVVMMDYGEFDLVAYVADRVHHFAYDRDGLRSKIGQVSQHDDDQYCHQSCRPDKILYILHTEDTVISARIEDLVTHQRGEQFGKCNRGPYHYQCHSHEPFHQVQLLVSPHHAETAEGDEGRDDEGRNAETA